MRSTLWWLGLIFGALSVVMLIKHGFEVSFASSFEVLASLYERSLEVLLGWIDPVVTDALRLLARTFVLPDLAVAPVWKQGFVLLLAVIGAVLRNVPLAPTQAIGLGLAWTLLAFVLAILWGVAMASELQSAITGFITMLPLLLFLAVDVSARAAFEASRNGDVESSDLGPILSPILIGQFFALGAIWIGLLIAAAQVLAFLHIYGPMNDVRTGGGTTLWFMTSVAAFSLALILSQLVLRLLPRDGGARDFPGANVGLSIALTFVGAALFFLTNAGLKLAGL